MKKAHDDDCFNCEGLDPTNVNLSGESPHRHLYKIISYI